MISRIIGIILLGVFFLSGCGGFKERRIEKIQSEYPHWDQATIEKVAVRKVEIGMTEEMVLAALGRPDAVSDEGDEKKWGYAVRIEYGWNFWYEFVYFVYFREGKVATTAGDWSRLGYWYY